MMPTDFHATRPQAPAAVLGPYRQMDYDRLPEQPRHELLCGNLVPVPSPSPWHQTAVCFLWRHLQRIASRARGRAYAAPLDVILADHTVVQPDVIYVSAGRAGILQDRILGAPDLLIEVLSPGTMRRDTGVKMSLYAQLGVPEYWIVDPSARLVEFRVNESGHFTAPPSLADRPGRAYVSPCLPEIHLDPAELWREIDREVS
jgi:Uma2 family endonuclease